MVIHQAIGQADAIETIHCPGQGIGKQIPVSVILDDRLAPVTEAADVIERGQEFNKQGSGDGPSVRYLVSYCSNRLEPVNSPDRVAAFAWTWCPASA